MVQDYQIHHDAKSLFFTTGPVPLAALATSNSNEESLGQCHEYPSNQQQEMVLGTSPIALASTTSFIIPQTRSPSGRPWCSDRKGFLSQFHPRPLLISTLRTVILQGTTTLTNYLTDQLEVESQNEEKFVSGDIVSPLRVDQLNAEWAATEWTKRWSDIHYKTGEALLKFHTMTALMRLYEWVLDRCIQDQERIDKYCKDTFSSAKRKEARRIEYIYNGSSQDGGRVVTSKWDLGDQMFRTCFYANAISFLADTTVQQGILAYGYYRYVMRKRNAIKLDRLSKLGEDLELDERAGEESASDVTFASVEGETSGKSSDESIGVISNDGRINAEKGGLILHYFIKSANISVSRLCALVLASAGGAVGSVVYPGWGTSFGTSMGDAMMGAILNNA